MNQVNKLQYSLTRGYSGLYRHTIVYQKYLISLNSVLRSRIILMQFRLQAPGRENNSVPALIFWLSLRNFKI
jgi:hypothetical protein